MAEPIGKPTPPLLNTSKDVWIHEDARGLGKAIESAILRSEADFTGVGAAFGVSSWTSKGAATFNRTEAIADLRALLVGSVYACCDASSYPPRELTPAQVKAALPTDSPAGATGGRAVLIGPRPPSTFDDPTVVTGGNPVAMDAALNIQLGWIAVCERQAQDVPEDIGTIRAWTLGASPPKALLGAVPEALGWPLAVAIVAGSAAFAYLGARAADVYDKRIALEQDTRRLVDLIAAATDTVQRHTDADRSLGKQTPYNEGEMAIVSQLGKLVTDYGEATKIRAKESGGSPVAAAAAGALSAVTLVAIAAAAYLLMKSTK